jgi:hypothetical protein
MPNGDRCADWLFDTANHQQDKTIWAKLFLKKSPTD